MFQRAEVWAVTTRKGGVLKTSLTVNMAGVLANKGKKVLIIDLDSQGNTLVNFGKNPDKLKYTVYDAMIGRIGPVQQAVVNVYENIDILPANDDMGQFEFEVIGNLEKYPKPNEILKESVRGLRMYYDYILIDTPPNFGIVQANALAFADKVIVPFQPEPFAMRALVKILRSIDSFKIKHNPNLKLMGVVATMVESRTSLHSEIMQETRKYCRKEKIPLLDTVIPKAVKFAKDTARRKLPTTVASPNDPAADCYFDLIEEVFDYAYQKQ